MRVKFEISLGLIAWGVAILFTAIFTTVRLTGHIDWAWYLVMSPVLLLAALYTLRFLLGFVMGLWSGHQRTKRSYWSRTGF